MRNIQVHLSREKGKLDRYFGKCVGAGRAAEVMRYEAFEQLKQIQKECPFKYIRFHGLFHEEMAIVSRNDCGETVYNFQYLDLLFDSLLSIGIRPIVELGLMPDVFAKEKAYVFWWKMNISTPEKMSDWEALVEETVKHLTRRYGVDEVKKWYFEVWNEPNHPAFFTKHDDKNEYFALYAAAARAVKRVCADYRVGGPATAGLEWVRETIDHCEQNGVPLDFVSTHQYCVSGFFDADGSKQLFLHPIEALTDGICRSAKLPHEKGYPFFITEWSASYSPRDRIHDSYVSAPFILEAVKRCEGSCDAFSYWTYTDIFEEVGLPPTPFHGGFGLFNVQGLKKPAYHAFAFLSKLGETELYTNDPSAYACKSEEGVQILFWNFVSPREKVANNTYYGKLLPAKELSDACLTVEGLAAGERYTVQMQNVGYQKGDVFSAYLKENFTDLPTREQTEELRKASEPKKETFDLCADENGVLRITLAQYENQADLIVITKNSIKKG